MTTNKQMQNKIKKESRILMLKIYSPTTQVGLTKDESGVTLVELLLGAGLLVVVMAAAIAMWQMFLGSFYTSYEGARDIPAANQTMMTLTREIREMTQGENGAYPLQIANDQELAFFVDEDNDDVVERVRYWLEGSELHRGVIEPEGDPVTYPEENESDTILVSAVQNGVDPIFDYYNGDWPGDTINNPLAYGSRLLGSKLITISLQVRYSENENQAPVMVSTSVALRGVKTNL